MQNKHALNIAAATVAMVLSSWASAADTPPVLTAPTKPGAPAAPSKAPGTIAAPVAPTLSYLQQTGPAKSTASAPAIPKATAAAPVVTPAVVATAPAACIATETNRCGAKPRKKPAPKRSYRPSNQVTAATAPAAVAVAVAKTPGSFDFRFSGDMWTALQLLSLKHGPLEVSTQGASFPIPVRLDLQGVTLVDAIAALGEQGGTAADVLYHHAGRTASLAYRNKNAIAIAPQDFTSKILPVRPPAPTPAAVPVNPIDEAKNWQRGGTARPIMGADGVMLYPFGQAQPTLTCMPLRACDVQLQAGEIINNVILGDTVRWIPAPATTGSGSQATPHVIVKPTEGGLTTNMIITTNRRTYMLTLASTEGQYVSRVGFYYPQEMVQDWNGQVEAERRKAEQDANRKVSDLPIASIEQLNLDSYKVKGNRNLPWYPVRVFDEGTHVWIQMPPSMRSSEAPALVLIGNDGTTELVNYRVKEAEQGGAKVTYYIVDKLFKKAALIVGVGNDQEKIEIIKTGQSWFNN
ncbi:P-type conjugative transfer protein TrbG [Massilia sp. MP_M2]|uniref:P-type conjugative transfer protein TrbG n=1 Tax=Massilia sp. MP_M2 TaxID=3071713 RepID=UPI00319E128D